jgi:hypothetical protein
MLNGAAKVVRALAVAGRKVVVGGTLIQSKARTGFGLARLNANGSLICA